MTATPQVSIVLPTYNGSRYLEESITSCLEQTFTDFELIIVDDFSKDATPEIIARFAAADSRIKPFRNDRNRRLPASLNRGFAESRGAYLTWTSDDNKYRPEAIAQMVQVLDEKPDVGLVYTPMTYIDEEGKLGGPAWGGGAPEMLAYRSPIGACFLYRREVYETIGGYAEDLFLVEDWEYWIRIAEKFPVWVHNEDLYLYRLHNQSLSRQRQEDHKAVTRRLLEKYLPRMHWASNEAKAHGYLLLARIAWSFCDRKATCKYVGKAISFAPTYAMCRLAEAPFKRRRRAQNALTVQ